jgi:biopolymer transport protein ExbB/TolQ
MKRKTTLITWLAGGVILALGPFWGLIGTILGMILAFQNLADGNPEVGVLADNISLALYTTAAGLVACPIGITIVVVSAIKLGKQETPRSVGR